MVLIWAYMYLVQNHKLTLFFRFFDCVIGTTHVTNPLFEISLEEFLHVTECNFEKKNQRNFE